jgi:Tol biopolymer transport system component
MAEQLSFSGAQDRFPRISNDGKYLFFVSNRWLGNRYFDSRLDLDAIKEKARSISNGLGNVFWVDAGIIEEIRRAQTP